MDRKRIRFFARRWQGWKRHKHVWGRWARQSSRAWLQNRVLFDATLGTFVVD